MKTFRTAAAAAALPLVLAGCAAGGPSFSSPYGSPYGGVPYGSPYGAPSYGYGEGYGSAGLPQQGAGGQGAMGALLGTAAALVLQSIAQSVWSGPIGTQLAPQDQTFRQQSLVTLLQGGAFDQPQQWNNPATGNSLMLTPLRALVDPGSRQTCHELEETYYLRGQPIKELHQACLDPATGRWALVR